MTISSAASRVQANVKDLFKGKLASGDAYIRLQLTSEITALLSMEQVQGSLVVEAEKITSLPCMPESVIGILSSRERVFCVFDIAQLLDLPTSINSYREYQIIVLQTATEEPIFIGLAMNFLRGIVRLSREQISKQSPDTFPGEMAAYISGVIQEGEEIIPILEFASILNTITTINKD